MPTFDELAEKLDQQATAHTEQAFVVRSLLLVFCILFMRITMGSFLFYSAATFAVFNYLVYLWVNTNLGVWGILMENFSITGAPLVTSQEKVTTRPWGTWGIIAANIFVYLFIQTSDNADFISDNLYCLPHDPSIFNVPWSFLSSMYLHADLMHIYGNMCFLWAVGTVVERRVGTLQFLKLYHLTGIGSHILALIAYFIILDDIPHSLGASGAISGVMGIFLIRCYFKKMTFPFPTFGILPISLNLQVNGLVVIALFFSFDLRGGISQFAGISGSYTGHWSHLGGMLVGTWMAWRMKLGDSAIEERHRDIGSGIIEGKAIKTQAFDEAGGFAGARKSLLIALEKDPENPETLLSLARIESHFEPTAEGREYFVKAFDVLIKNAPTQLTAAFTEYFVRYGDIINPELQFKIAGLLYKEGNLDLAERVLKMLADYQNAPLGIREQSLLLSGRILEKMELHEAAGGSYRQFLERYPGSTRVEIVKERLAAVSA